MSEDTNERIIEHTNKQTDGRTNICDLFTVISNQAKVTHTTSVSPSVGVAMVTILLSLPLMNLLISGFQASRACRRRSRATSSSATVLLYVADTEAGTLALRLLFLPLDSPGKYKNTRTQG